MSLQRVREAKRRLMVRRPSKKKRVSVKVLPPTVVLKTEPHLKVIEE
jgi:hypothetical protein